MRLSLAIIIINFFMINHGVWANDGFDFIKAYRINQIKEQITENCQGRFCNIGVLEDVGLINHCAFNGSEIITLEGKHKKTPGQVKPYSAHANHVAGLIAGSPCSGFKGGILANMGATLVQAPLPSYVLGHSQSDTNGMIDALEELAKRSPIINRSGPITDEEFSLNKQKINNRYEKLTDAQIARIKTILEENDSVLVVTASNAKAIFDVEGTSTYALAQLLASGLEDRILIVANLEYVDEMTLKNWSQYAAGKEELLNFLETNKDLEDRIPYNNLGALLVEVINHYYPEDFSSYPVTKRRLIELLMNLDNKERFNFKYDPFPFDKESYFMEALTHGYPKIVGMMDYFLRKYVSWQKLDSDKYFQDLISLQTYETAVNELRQDIAKSFNDAPRLPSGKEENFLNSGKLNSMIAGDNEVVQNNFIAAYGTNIYSACDIKGQNLFCLQTGSSMSAPIVTGIISLFHMAANERGYNLSFVDVIRMVKNTARQVGEKSSFGRGIIDVEALFSEIGMAL